MITSESWTDRDSSAFVMALVQAGDQPAGMFIRDKLERQDLSCELARNFIHAVALAAGRVDAGRMTK